MTGLAIILLSAAVVLGGLVEFSILAARRIEKAVPPRGGFLDLDGERLHVLDKGAGAAVVMIHGLGGEMENFTHSLVDRLCKDFRVVVFDRPGSGYSTRSVECSAGVRAQADMLAKAIRALKLDCPLVVGHSFGGAVALAIALDHPDCVGGLALLSPVTQPMSRAPSVYRVLAIRSPLLRWLFAWTLATPGALLVRKVVFEAPFAPEPAPPDFATTGGGLLALRPRDVYATSSDMVAMALTNDLEKMTERYASLRIPVGILYGRGDRILDYHAHGETMKQKIPTLDLELVEGGHMLPVTQPDLVAGFVRRMAAHIPARASVGRKLEHVSKNRNSARAERCAEDGPTPITRP